MPRYSVSTPLIKAVQQASLDVISLLLENGADTEIACGQAETPLFFARTAAVTKELLKHGANVNHENYSGQTPVFHMYVASIDIEKELLRHGANVNHRDTTGITALFGAILNERRDLVEFLISNGADVNISRKASTGVIFESSSYGFTPLHTALRVFNGFKYRSLVGDDRLNPRIVRIQDYFDIIKLIVPLCNDISVAVRPWIAEPCVVHFFKAETEHGWGDLMVTKYLLRHGASAEFSRIYDCIFNCKFEIEPLTEAFLKLTILAGCKFNKYFNDIKSAPHRNPKHPENASLVQLVQELIMDLFSQPLTLQEMAVMAIRKYISSPKLWAKIDTLSDPPLIKHLIKLKTYSDSGRTDFDFKCRVYRQSGRTGFDVRRVQCRTHLCINVCKSIL